MKCTGYMNINSRGTIRFSKNKVGLEWNEIAIKINLDIPDEFFKKPILEAKIEIDKNLIPKPEPFDIIINTKKLIEESTGAKIQFSVLPFEEDKK